MSIKVSINARKNPTRPQDPPMYYAVAQTRAVIDIDRICREVAWATSLTEGDVYNVVRTLPYKIKEHTADGDMVDLGHLGKFSYKVSGEGAESRDKYTYNLIKKVKFQYTPSKLMLESLDKLDFEEVITLEEMKEAKRQAKAK